MHWQFRIYLVFATTLTGMVVAFARFGGLFLPIRSKKSCENSAFVCACRSGMLIGIVAPTCCRTKTSCNFALIQWRNVKRFSALFTRFFFARFTMTPKISTFLASLHRFECNCNAVKDAILALPRAGVMNMFTFFRTGHSRIGWVCGKFFAAYNANACLPIYVTRVSTFARTEPSNAGAQSAAAFEFFAAVFTGCGDKFSAHRVRSLETKSPRSRGSSECANAYHTAIGATDTKENALFT